MYDVVGYYCNLNVKTVHQYFLRKELKGVLNASDDVATYKSSFIVVDGKAEEIFGSGQMEKQPLLLWRLVRPISLGSSASSLLQ